MSAVDVTIGDKTYFDISDWSVQKASMPHTPGDMSGGVDSVSFTLPEAKEARTSAGKSFVFADADATPVDGEIALAGGNSVNATLTGVTRISKLNVNRTVEPFEGTLQAYLVYLFSLCGVQATISTPPGTLRFIGWEGNVLDRVKDLCSTFNLDAYQTQQDAWTFYPGTLAYVSAHSIADATWQQDDTQLTQAVEVSWNDTKPIANQLIYPAGGWHEDVRVFTVEAGETVVEEIDLTSPEDEESEGWGMSAISVVQPVCVDSVNRYHKTSSVYAVSGNDGLPIKAKQWTDGGGKITVELTEGGSKLSITITAPVQEQYAPYSISMSAGASNSYSSLRIYGRGMLYKTRTIKALTGLDADRAPQEVAARVSHPFLNSKERAWRAVEKLLAKHGAPTTTLQGTYGELRSGTTGKPFTPEDHLLLPAARMVVDGGIWRNRTINYTPSSITFTAEPRWDSTTLSAFTYPLVDAAPSYLTAAEFNALYADSPTAAEYNANALKGFAL